MEVDSENCRTLTATNVAPSLSSDTSTAVPQRRDIKLTSVLQLRNTIEKDMHSGKLVAPSAVPKQLFVCLYLENLLTAFCCLP